jgi:hypothetical protein
MLSYYEIFNDGVMSEDFNYFKRNKNLSRFPYFYSKLLNHSIDDDDFDSSSSSWSLDNGYTSDDDEILRIKAKKHNSI